MTPSEIARLYVMAVELDERAQRADDGIQEQAGLLRSEIHALLMQVLREHHIPFSDRTDAAAWAYQTVRQQTIA
jgi:hypothetical protein